MANVANMVLGVEFSTSVVFQTRTRTHSDAVSGLVELDDETIVSCSQETVKLWSRTGELLNSFEDPSDRTPRVIGLDNDIIVKTSLQGIKVWNVRTSECLRTVNMFSRNKVERLLRLGDKTTVLTTHREGVYKLWRTPAFECFRVFQRWSSAESVAQLKNGDIVIGDKSIHVWNSDGTLHKTTLEGHKSWVLSLIELSNNTLASGSKDKTIKIWNTITWSCIHTLVDHSQAVLRLTKLKDGSLVSVSYDETVRVWNTEGKCVLTHSVEIDIETITTLRDGSIIVGGYEGQIEIWNLTIITLVKLCCKLIATTREDVKELKGVMPTELYEAICEAKEQMQRAAASIRTPLLLPA
eukprot:TRINITY_DN446_c0_g3_i1.p1 TRINITY_DN446_c0_g3~~TRINITY_DN446_c0_g3_i1.p1  ORF type:complete len:353 (-),score=65.10 TRINITY_DN446_c0_g3_i1:210-1268(-)